MAGAANDRLGSPHTGWFCPHRLALFSLRTGADNPKREKDAFQAAALATALAREQDFRLSEAIDGMDKALRTRVKPGAKRALAYFASDYPDTAQAMETLA